QQGRGDRRGLAGAGGRLEDGGPGVVQRAAEVRENGFDGKHAHKMGHR
ncbi:MAG: hypothetical protein HUU26_09760, partial [Gemmatimonadaceae bacterium]|nr:hypothetical protein [Gemmatimonadaceae bacterium]